MAGSRRAWAFAVSHVAVAAVAFAAGIWAAAVWLRPLPRLQDAQRWADLGRWDEAEADVTEYLLHRPSDAPALMLAARVAAARRQLDRCVELLEQVPPDAPQKLDALLRQGQALRELGYGRRAEQAFQAVLDLAERVTGSASGTRVAATAHLQAAQAELASLWSLERRDEEASRMLWTMYPGHREQWRILISLARVHGPPTRPELAIAMLEQCLQRDPADVHARRARAEYRLRLQQYAEAAADAEQCLAQRPGDAATLEILLSCYLAEQQFDKMDELLAEHVSELTSATAWRLRGRRHQVAGRLEQAEQCFRIAVDSKPNEPVSHFDLANVLVRRGAREAAESEMQQYQQLQAHEESLEKFLADVINRDPETWECPEPATCIELSQHCEALGRTDEARAWLAEALRQQPEQPEALSALRRLELERGGQSVPGANQSH